jgi:hypothetical protein
MENAWISSSVSAVFSPVRRRVLGVLTIATVTGSLFALLALDSSVADGQELKRCRDVVIRTGDGTIYTRTRGLWARGVNCRVARGVAHTMLSFEGSAEAPPTPRGFRCEGGSDGVSCKRGSDWVTWGYYYDRPGPIAIRLAPAARVECLVGGKQAYRVAPGRCILYEHGSQATAILTSMRWNNWGKPRTRGRGLIQFYDHPEYTGRVVVGLARLRGGGCLRGRFYTAAHIHVISGEAAGNIFDLKLAAGCPA